MSQCRFIFSCVLMLLLGSSGAVAAKSKSKTKKNAATTAKANSKSKAISLKKKTVADLMAQMGEESRGGKAQMQKKLTPIPEAKLSFQGEKRNLEEIKPPKSSEIFQREGGLKAEYEKVLDQQINELYKLTRQFKASGNRGELWLRLAELYVEKAALIDMLKQNQYDQKLRAFQAGKTNKKPQLDLKEARDFNRKALQLYEWFERDFPRDNKMAQALFFLGYNHFELGNTKKASQYYDKLIKKYPESPFTQEAHFALGEYAFDNDRWTEAYKNYSPLIKQKNHPLHSFAMYKGAWALFRLGKSQQALNYIEYIIKSGRAEATGELAGKKAVNKGRLENEALRDLVVFYGAVGSAEKAESYFGSLVDGDISPHMEKLATYYTERGNKDASSHILRSLISKNPSGPKAFSYQYQIVQNYFYAKNSPRFKEELYRWVKDYDQKSSWYEANASNKDLVENSMKLRETTLKNYALQQHQTAQNSRAPYSQSQANEAYSLYINTFSDGPHVGDMHFYFGELLYDMGKYDEASTHYNWVVQNAPKNKFFGKSAENLIHAAEKGLPNEKELLKKVGASLDPVPLDPKVEKFISAGQWYTQTFPQSDKNAEIQFRMGRLYYQNNYFDEASAAFKGIVKKYPRTKYAEYSANLILDIFSLKKDYVGLEKTGGELLQNPAFADSKAGADIRGVIEKANFKRAQDLEVSQNYGESAVQYEAFAKQNPKSELAVQALFNAAVNYEKAGQNPQAIMAHQQVIADKSGSHPELKKKSKRLSAKILQDAGQYEEAAKLFREVAHADMKDPLAPNLIFTAAVLLEAMGRNDEAVRSYDEFLKIGKKHQDKMDAVYSMAQIHRKAGQKRPAILRFEEYVDSNSPDSAKVMESQFRLWEIYSSQRKVEDAEEWRKKVLAMYRRLPASKKKSLAHFAAKARMKDAEEAVNKYKAIRLPADAAKLQKALAEKLQLLKEVKKQISDVIEYDSADEIVTGLTLLGQSYQNMGDSILKAPLPKGLTVEETKMYKEKVEKELAEPQYKQARESYQKAVEKSFELESYPPSLEIAFKYMNKIDPINYYEGGEVPMDSRLVDWMVK